MLRAGKIVLLGSALAALSACEIKQEKGSPEPVETDPAEVSPTPTGSPASILRPDVQQPAQPKPAPLKPIETVVSFARGGSELDQSATAVLDTLLATPQASATGAIILRGHSDAGGSGATNLAESEARAVAVRDYLVEQGVDEKRITQIAFGEQNPVEPNALPDGSPNESGRAANRRVDIRVEPPKPAPRPPAATDLTEGSS